MRYSDCAMVHPLSYTLISFDRNIVRCVCAARPRGWSTRKSTRSYNSTSSNDHLPRLAQSSLWETIFPPTIRQKTRELLRPPRKKPTNPASYFIWIYLLIGSQAIRILGLKNESEVYMRRADLQITKLREVIDKLQRGEPVDIEKALGTGNETEEQEWENALREIEREEREWQQSREDKEDQVRRSEEQQSKFDLQQQDASPLNPNLTTDTALDVGKTPPTAPGFF